VPTESPSLVSRLHVPSPRPSCTTLPPPTLMATKFLPTLSLKCYESADQVVETVRSKGDPVFMVGLSDITGHLFPRSLTHILWLFSTRSEHRLLGTLCLPVTPKMRPQALPADTAQISVQSTTPTLHSQNAFQSLTLKDITTGNPLGQAPAPAKVSR
jgi:hypothetical protein